MFVPLHTGREVARVRMAEHSSSTINAVPTLVNGEIPYDVFHLVSDFHLRYDAQLNT